MAAMISARPAMRPAWGPPSSLSPENVTTSAPSASDASTVGSSASQGSCLPAMLWRSSPLPMSWIRGMPPPGAAWASSASSRPDTDAVKPTTW